MTQQNNGKRIVLALGGNALGNNLHEQMIAAKTAAKSVTKLIRLGHEVVITHGNGPQVGMINLAMETAHRADANIHYIPMSVCVAMSQGYIGYDIQNALREQLLHDGIDKAVVTVVTQTMVDENDPAFNNPTKPIGAFYTEAEAREMMENGYIMKEDAGRGFRRVIASPKPMGIVECESIRALLKASQIPIAVGGGGIPVKKTDERELKGISAVVDKDFASAKLAHELDADMLIILTAVEKVSINYGKAGEIALDEISASEAKEYIAQGHFAPGSMLPKVEAAVEFVEQGTNRKAIITLLEKAEEALTGKTGTVILSGDH